MPVRAMDDSLQPRLQKGPRDCDRSSEVSLFRCAIPNSAIAGVGGQIDVIVVLPRQALSRVSRHRVRLLPP